MKKEIRTVDKERGILQVTTVDERWYVKESKDEETGLPKHEYVPSVTWICDHYPKGVAFYKWLASKGWDESQAIKSAAGDKGSKVHYAIRDLIEGRVVQHEAGMSGAQQIEEVQPALRWPRAEPGEPVAADLRAITVGPGVPRAGVVNGDVG